MIQLKIYNLPVPVRAYLVIAKLMADNPNRSCEEILRSLQEKVTVTMNQVSQVSPDDKTMLNSFSLDADILLEATHILEASFEDMPIQRKSA